MGLGLGPLPVLLTFWGQRAVRPAWRIQKERVIVPWAGRRHWVIGGSGSDAPGT